MWILSVGTCFLKWGGSLSVSVWSAEHMQPDVSEVENSMQS